MAHKTFWQRAEQLPPILVRLLARHPHGKPLTDAEIGMRMFDLPGPVPFAETAVRIISDAESWNFVGLSAMNSFLSACRIDFCNVAQMKKVDSYLRSKPSFTYLRRHPEWQTKWAPMLEKWRKSLAR